MATTTNPTALLDLLAELGVSPEALAQAVGATQVATQVATAQAVRPSVKAENVDRPASRAQRRHILMLTGIYPANSTGFTGITKGQASKAIEALKSGKTFKVGRKTLKPKA